MIYACNWYQNDRQGEQNLNSWPILIFYFEKFGGKFKIRTSVSSFSTKRTLIWCQFDILIHCASEGQFSWASWLCIHYYSRPKSQFSTRHVCHCRRFVWFHHQSETLLLRVLQVTSLTMAFHPLLMAWWWCKASGRSPSCCLWNEFESG